MNILYRTWQNDNRLAKGDVTKALEAYRKETGVPPARVLLNPKNEKLIFEVPDSIPAELYTGVLSSEVMFFVGTSVMKEKPETRPAAPTGTVMTALEDRETSISKLPAPVIPHQSSYEIARVVLKHAGGRPRKPDGEPVSPTTAWRRRKEMQGVMKI